MRFAGFDKDITSEANVDAFMEQAVEYKKLVADSKWNKTLEFLMFSHIDHPLNAVRAYECNEWQNSKNFAEIINYLKRDEMTTDEEVNHNLPLPEASKHYVGLKYIDAQSMLQEIGFTNIELVRVTEKGKTTKERQVLSLSINGEDDFKMGSWFSYDAPIIITYYEAETEEEIIAAHAGQIRVPDSAKRYVGRDYQQVINELKDAGFTEFVAEEQKDLKKGWLNKEGSIARITIEGQSQFEKGNWFEPDVTIRISYHTFNIELTGTEK